MLKNIFKKIIVLTAIFSFLFTLVFPFNSSEAQILYPNLSASPQSVSLGQPTTLTMKMDTGPSNVTFSTQTTGVTGGVTFNPSTCTTVATGSNWSCSTSFSSSTSGGLFTINATSSNSRGETKTATTQVSVSPSCVSPYCTINCTAPETFVNGKCTCVVPPNKLEGGKCVAPILYNLLSPIDKGITSFDPSQDNALSKYLNIMIRVAIGIAAVLAMVMIVMGGIEYMTSDLVSSKEEGKKRIRNALLGLVIALSAFLILNTINPELLNIEPKLDSTSVEFTDVPEDNNYSLAEAENIISKAVTNKNVTIGTTQAGDVMIKGGGVINKATNVVTKDGLRTVRAIIMHWTGGSTAQSALATWINNNTDSVTKNDNGAHFIIDKDGSIWETVPINKRANHFIPNATAKQLGISNYNTIGIEIVSTGPNDPPSQKQIDSTVRLTQYLISYFNLTSKDIYGHGKIGLNRMAEENYPMIRAILPKL